MDAEQAEGRGDESSIAATVFVNSEPFASGAAAYLSPNSAAARPDRLQIVAG
jgi:hypothetical protein